MGMGTLIGQKVKTAWPEKGGSSSLLRNFTGEIEPNSEEKNDWRSATSVEQRLVASCYLVSRGFFKCTAPEQI